METIIALIMDMDMKTIVKSTSMAINVMDTSMSTKTISMSTKITSMSTKTIKMSTKIISMSKKTTSMSISMNINMETIVKDINTKMKNTIIHLKKSHTNMIMIMETAKEGMIMHTLLNLMKKMCIKKIKKIQKKSINMK